MKPIFKKILLSLYLVLQCFVLFILFLVNMFLIDYKEFNIEDFFYDYIYGVDLVVLFVAIFSTLKLIMNKKLNIYQKICSILSISAYIHLTYIYLGMVKYGM